MADVKISGLPASTVPLAGTEVLPIVQSGATKQVSIANVTAGRDVSALTLAISGTTSTTSVLSFNAANTNLSLGGTISGSYLQAIMQNKSGTAGASTNYVLSNDLGTDSTYYGEFGMNSSVYSSGTPADYFSINNGIYYSGHDGDVTYGSGNGKKTYLAWGTTGQSAHVINATGALGFSTNLGTTPALSGTTGFGNSGEVLVSGGSAAAPAWSGSLTGLTTVTTANDASISSLTVGKGAGGVASNTVCGNAALGSNVTGAQNVAVGQQALRVATASNNTAVGYQAGYTNSSGGQNTFIGSSAGFSVSTGGYNTALGYGAGYLGTALTTGSYNTYIGYNAQASAAAPTNELVISVSGGVGKGTSTGFITPSSGIYQGNNSAAWSITSDKRLKKNIVNNTIGLDAITAIQVRNFEYRAAEEVTELEPTCAIDIQGIQLGAIAQELQAILPECVKTESTGVMSIDTTNLTWYLINAVKELSAKFDAYVASHP